MATLTANSVRSAATRSVPECTASATNASEPVTRPVTSLTVTSTTAAATLRSAARRRARASRRSSAPRGSVAPSRGAPAAMLTARLSRRDPPPAHPTGCSPPAPPGPSGASPRRASSTKQSRQQPPRALRLLRLQQLPAQLARGAAAVADRVLLLGRELRHRQVTRVVVRDEGRVVPEASLAPRLVGEPALAAAVHNELAPARLDVCNRAQIRHARVAVGRDLAQQLAEVVLVGGVLARKARRPHPGGTAERGCLDAGVVGDRGESGRRGGRARLAERVVREGGADLGRERGLLRQRLELDRPHQLSELAQLVVVTGCEDEPHRLRRPLAGRRAHRFLLRGAEALDARGGEREQLVERRARERCALGGGLDLHQAAVTGNHHVGVDLGGRVLGVVEVEQGLPVDDPARHRRHRPVERHPVELPPADESAQGELERHVATGDRGAASAAVGLEHVAVDPHGALAETLEVDHAAERAPDEALDLDGAAVGAPLGDAPPLPLTGRRGEHPVLGGGPAAALAGHPARNLFVHARRADHPRAARLDEARPARGANEARDDVDLAEVAGRAAVVAEAAHAAARFPIGIFTSTCSTFPIGSWRNRVPTRRNSSGSPVARNPYRPRRPSSFSSLASRSRVSTSSAIASPELTIVTPRPSSRWSTGRTSG